MHKIITWAAAAGGAIAGYLWGEMDGFLFALIIFMVLDYVTGVLVAAIRRELSSKVGFRGLAKKAMIMAIIALAHVIDEYVLSGDHDVWRSAATGLYLANEGLSILENGDALGIKYPKGLKKLLKQIQETSEKEDEK